MSGPADVVIIGAGHNGLVAANYLADAGMRVTVIERREIVGGACVTEELVPGFRGSSCAFVAGPGLAGRIMRDLELAQYGLELYQTDPLAVNIDRSGGWFALHRALDQTLNSLVRRFGVRETERFVRFGAQLQKVAEIVRPSLLADPPSFDGLRVAFEERGAEHLFHQFLEGSISDLLNSHLDSPELKGFLAFLGLTSVYGGPRSAGTAYIYSYHSWGDFQGRFGEFGYARGGMGAISDALAARARSRGVDIRTDTDVRQIVVANGRGVGVALGDGGELEAHVVISNADPRRTFLDLIAPDVLDVDFIKGVRGLDFRGTMGRVHIAVDRLPTFAGFSVPEQASLHRALVMLGADLESFQRAFTAQEKGEMIDDPCIELTIQSVHDDSLAPPGRHLITTGIQQLPFELRRGSWDDTRDRFAAQAIDAIERYAPGFRSTVIGTRTITPLDLEREYFLTKGNLFHGAMTADQLFAARPLPMMDGYRTPVPGVYLCGSGVHPGGGVTGAPGHNSARAVLGDLGLPFRGETADWQAHLPPPGTDLVEEVLKRPRSRRMAVSLARKRWLRPITNRARAG